jgi:type II secretory pathway pseudopilin PulG
VISELLSGNYTTQASARNRSEATKNARVDATTALGGGQQRTPSPIRSTSESQLSSPSSRNSSPRSSSPVTTSKLSSIKAPKAVVEPNGHTFYEV